MNLNCLFFLFLICVFILHINGSQKAIAALTTTAANPKKQPMQDSTLEQKKQNFDLQFNENGSLKELVDNILEADVSGEDGENLLENSTFQSKRNSVNGTLDFTLSRRLQLEEMPDSDEELIIEQKVEVKLEDFNQQNASSTRNRQPMRECDRSLNEYRVLSLIASGELPHDAVFTAWNQLNTLTKKLNFLNQTLVDNKLQPLPNCDVRDLNLILSPKRLGFFKAYTMSLTTPKTGELWVVANLKIFIKCLLAKNA